MKISAYTLEELIDLPINEKQVKTICEAIKYNLSKKTSKVMAGVAQHILVRNNGTASLNKIVTVENHSVKERLPLTTLIGERTVLGKFSSSDFKDETAELKLIDFIEKRNEIIKKFLIRYEKNGGINKYREKRDIEPDQKAVTESEKGEEKANIDNVVEKILDIAPIISDLPRDKQRAILEALCAK